MSTPTTAPLRTVVKKAFEDQIHQLHSDQWDTHYRSLGMDSLEHVELIMSIEKELNITIPDIMAEELTSPNKILRYLESH